MTNYNFSRVFIIAVASFLAACETVDTKDERNFEIDGILVSQYPINKKLEIANNEYEKGALFEAEKNYLNILSDHPGISDAWFKLGNIYYRSGRYKAAVNAFESVLKLDNMHDKAWYNLSLARVSQAIEVIDTSLGILERDSEAYIRGILLKKNLLNRISAVENEEIRAKNLKANQDNQFGERLNRRPGIANSGKFDEGTNENPIVTESSIAPATKNLDSSTLEIDTQTQGLNREGKLIYERIQGVENRIESSTKDLEEEGEKISEIDKENLVQSSIIPNQKDLDSLTPKIQDQTQSLNQEGKLILEKIQGVENTETNIIEDETDIDLTEGDLESSLIEMLEKKEPLNQSSNLMRADEKNESDSNEESSNYNSSISDAVDVLSERSFEGSRPNWIVEPFTQELRDSLLEKEGE